VRDAVQAGRAPAPGDASGDTRAKTDPIAALETIHRITKLR
jgi:hypothetical protein